MTEFYDEIEKKLTNGLDWKIGRNVDTFNDVLNGRFGVHDYEEAIKLRWENSAKSKRDLGQKSTVKFIQEKLTTCHPANISSVKSDLEDAKSGKGQLLFEIIVDITRGHGHIQLDLQ